MATAKKKVTHGRGGFRPGSGRKRGDTQLVSWRLSRGTVAAVKAKAAEAGCQPGRFVEQILQQALGNLRNQNKFPTLAFRFAKTTTEMPHWYVKRSPENEAEYVRLFRAIGEEGVWEQFQGVHYKYYYPGDGFKYWRMTNSLEKSQVINRAKVEC